MAYATSHGWEESSRSNVFDRRLLAYGFADFLIYVAAVGAVVSADSGFFGLWALIAPFGFLLTCMPIGPVSAAYWSGCKGSVKPPPALTFDEAEEQLLRVRVILKSLEAEAGLLESEMVEAAQAVESLRSLFEREIDVTRTIRSRIAFEVVRLDGRLSYIQDARRLSVVCRG